MAGDGPRLRRGARRQAARRRARRTSTSGSRSTSSARASRSLMVPCDQGRRRARLRRLPLLLRGADHQDPREQAHRRRLPGHQHHPDQPGRARHGRLGAAADDRPGDDRRHRLDRLPGRVGARAAREAQGARDLEGDDDDVHLRPPHHPGRRVGLVPAADRPAAPGRGRASTRRSPRRSRSRPASSRPRTRPRPPRRRSAGAAGAADAPAARRRRRGAAAGGPGGDLAAQGLPHPRPPRRPPRPARRPSPRATRRSSPRTST